MTVPCHVVALLVQVLYFADDVEHGTVGLVHVVGYGVDNVDLLLGRADDDVGAVHLVADDERVADYEIMVWGP